MVYKFWVNIHNRWTYRLWSQILFTYHFSQIQSIFAILYSRLL